MKILLLVITSLFLSSYAMAYELNGTVDSYNNGNGTYSVVLQNEDGHEYMGSAVKLPNGTLSVTVADDKGDTYTGTAIEEDEGDFTLNLTNPNTGTQANGELENDFE